MKLSNAILLGDSLKRANSAAYLAEYHGEISGCALGGALLASAISLDELRNKCIVEKIMTLWPWIRKSQIDRISVMYSRSVHSRDITIEEIADYARSIEPAEEPENQEPLEKENGEPEEEPEDERDTYSSMAVAQAQYSDQGVK